MLRAWLPPVTTAFPGGARIQSPLKSVDFLDAYPALLDQKFTVTSLQDCLDDSGKCPPPSAPWRPAGALCWGGRGRRRQWLAGTPDIGVRSTRWPMRAPRISLWGREPGADSQGEAGAHRPEGEVGPLPHTGPRHGVPGRPGASPVLCV